MDRSELGSYSARSDGAVRSSGEGSESSGAANSLPECGSRRGTWLTFKVRSWLERAEERAVAKVCGGDQLCPWCRRWMNRFPVTYIRDFAVLDLEEITCGNCFGTSIWRWEMGFFFVSSGDPPTGANRAPTYTDSEFTRGVVLDVRRVLAERHKQRSAVRPDVGWTLPPRPDATGIDRGRDEPNPTRSEQ